MEDIQRRREEREAREREEKFKNFKSYFLKKVLEIVKYVLDLVRKFVRHLSNTSLK